MGVGRAAWCAALVTALCAIRRDVSQASAAALFVPTHGGLRLRGGDGTAGVGAQLSIDSKNRVYFSHLVPGRAASASGAIQVGDFLTAVDGWPLPEMAGEDSTQQVNLVALAAKIVGDAGTNVTLSVARVQEAPPPPPSPGRSAAPALPEERFNVTLTRAVAPLGPVLSTPDALPSPRGDGLPPKTPPRHADAARAGGAQPRRPHEFSVGEIGKQLRTMQLSPERKGEGEAGEGAGDGAPPADAASGEGGAPDGAPAAAREDAEAGSGAARLLAAAADGDVARIKRLVAGGVTVGSRDEAWFSDTPLHFAALEGHVDAIRALVQLGADVDAANADGKTPLHYAAAQKRAGACSTLVELGADEARRSNAGLTAAEEAAALERADAPPEDVLRDGDGDSSSSSSE